MLDGLTADQLRMFVAVAEAGSFSGAARRLSRAQSAVSHAIERLEDQLQLQLFERTGKRPALTAQGHALIAEARAIVARMDAFRSRGRRLADGLEGEVSIAFSLLAPIEAFVEVLKTFRTEFPTVALQVDVLEVGVPAENVLAGRSDIAITASPVLGTPKGQALVRHPLGSVAMVAVASPDHPLARLQRPIALEDVRELRQLIPTSGRLVSYRHVHAADVWRITDQAARSAMLRAGLGWGFTARHAVQADIEAGDLVELKMAFRHDLDEVESLFAVHLATRQLGPAGRRLIELLAEAW